MFKGEGIIFPRLKVLLQTCSQANFGRTEHGYILHIVELLKL